MVAHKLEKLSSSRCHSGRSEKYQHFSESCQSTMKFSIFVPDNDENKKLPGLYLLAGLTGNEDDFITKAGAIKLASDKQLFLICPDNSPRNTGTEGEDDDMNLGSGAGFYIDAIEPKWARNYQMYTYVVEELPKLIYENFLVDPEKVSISGFSMGGHGALTIALKNSQKYKSCSAFTPICNLTKTDWGKNACLNYLGKDEAWWQKYDATELMRGLGGVAPIPILIDQGSDDIFYNLGLLHPETFLEAVRTDSGGKPVTYSLRVGHDHSFWFVQTYIENHIAFHAKYLFQ